ncbi:MAG: crossover junction endodeoxyribonuclease RuvC [Parcubacteria group bacterium RIFOXYD2_FULL_52_8]|nr:MAG: crossover junction endodeoxyribonuclease RuvC [Parcubacteria group bacterium RIFOXYD2_FULL_52_8]
MRVLAVDPGYERLGVAVVERTGGKDSLLFSTCLQTPKGEFAKRLLALGDKFAAIIVAWQPEAFAVEKLFFTTNQKTALGVAEVKGMLTYLAATHRLPVYEYTPLEVKVAVASYGRADKKQVIDMVHRLVMITKKIAHDDEYDAIAIGLTCVASVRK